MKTSLLDVKALTKEFPGVKALDQVSFTLGEGEVHALCGENGAGKSTLIKSISGIWEHGSYDGEIWVNGQMAKFKGIADAENAGISVIYQELAMVEEMTVAENVFLGREPVRNGLIDWHKVYEDCRTILVKYKLDNIDPAARVGDLSVGQQQLVEIVKALAKESKILLLDEPTAALTEEEVEKLLEIIRDLRSRGISCLYISHRLDEVMEISDTITVIRDGQSIKTAPRAEWTKTSLIQNMCGREIKDLFPKKKAESKEVLLSVENLSVHHAGYDLVKDVSFELRAGEVLGIGGLMGAGRSELLMHIFCGIGERSAGVVKLKGNKLEGNDAGQSIDQGLIMVTEDRKRLGLVLDESIFFNLSLSHLSSFTKNGLINGHAEYKENDHFFKFLRVKAPTMEYRVGGLSGGNQQKVVLGKALMTKPDIVFLDEPTRGIDVGAKVEVYELMNKLTSEGKAVILVSSELPELLGMSDRVLMLSAGRNAGVFPVSPELTQHDLLEAAMKYS
ncbi:sugar ABC transporter ATP-binding protein [Lentisphaera profundi]|uniref:Sugar ABC transporter ATP-binding protein n=1 Tax=Lentisphaera profundi TaxID=1658616 RepID=A0ABY7VYY5_9BACT|nr:sugar ABC transporter ATP-binding protein [Lentisphaera profundi]WDE98474.1 sugar ABC transporter ATP-binding protein [Lentisphaera profundi]